jgi:hypothetical protein
MFPDVSNLTKVTSLYMSWRDCRLAKSFPYVNSLTNVTALAGANGGAWMSCSSATGFPEVSALIKNTTLLYTWQGCTSVVDAFPNVSTLTNVTDMRHTWSGNTGYTGDIAVIFANTNAGMPFLTTSSNAFANCRSMTGNGMRFVNMSKSATYWANTGGPAFVSCAKTFYNCTNLSDYATIPLEYK